MVHISSCVQNIQVSAVPCKTGMHISGKQEDCFASRVVQVIVWQHFIAPDTSYVYSVLGVCVSLQSVDRDGYV